MASCTLLSPALNKPPIHLSSHRIIRECPLQSDAELPQLQSVLFPWRPEPLVMLMMHSSPSITSPLKQHPSNHLNTHFSLPSGPPLFVTLPHQVLGSPLRNWPPRNHPPHTPFTHFVRSSNLKPCLSAGFRDRYAYYIRYYNTILAWMLF